jgi:hypothetical protein
VGKEDVREEIVHVGCMDEGMTPQGQWCTRLKQEAPGDVDEEAIAPFCHTILFRRGREGISVGDLVGSEEA